MGAALVVSALPHCVMAQQFKRTRAGIEQLLKPLFATDDPALWRFTVDVYERCIFGRMQAAEPPLKHPWLIPGGIYVGQWIWDTTFLTDLLAIVPGQKEFIRGIYQNYGDSKQRWSAAKPEYAQGTIANFIAPDRGPAGFTGKDWLTFPAYSPAPLIAWGIERVWRRNHDLELVRAALKSLEAFHDWYWRERDLDGVGLVTVGVYDGSLQHARYETYDNEVDLDTLALTPHPGRKSGPKNGPWYGNIYIPANTAYLLLSEQSLIRLAEAVGDKVLAARMAHAFATPHWKTPVPLPSVDAKASEYRSDGFWRGDVWPSSVYQILEGLASYGHREVAGPLADRLLANAIKVGISEHYDSQSGAPLGVPDLGMSAVMLTIALEGLSPRYTIRAA
jgi:hypothetical protein